MGWINWPYWAKGGSVGLILFVVFTLALIPGSTSTTTLKGFLLPSAPGYFLLNLLTQSNPSLGAIDYIASSAIIYLLVGAIIFSIAGAIIERNA